jgi:hypothetical protein
MQGQPHSIDALRFMLMTLRNTIETLEAAAKLNPRSQLRLRQRIEEAKIQETVILAKLAERGVKL